MREAHGGHRSAPGGHSGHGACRGAQLRGRGVRHCRGGKAARGVTGKGVLIPQSFRIGLRGQKWQRMLKEQRWRETGVRQGLKAAPRQLPVLPPVTQQGAPLQQKASSPTLANFSPSSLFTTLSWAESTCQQQRASWDDLGGQHWAAPTPPAPSCPNAPKLGQPGAAGARRKAPLAPLCSGLWVLLNAFKGPDSPLLPFCHSPRGFLGTTSHGQAHPKVSSSSARLTLFPSSMRTTSCCAYS